MGSYSVDRWSGTWRGTSVGSCSAVQCLSRLMGQPLLFSCQCWRVGRERLWWWPHPLHVTQQYHLASVAAWLSSTGIFHHDPLPHIPSVNSSPCLRIAAQPLSSSSQPCAFQKTSDPIWGMYGCGKDCLIFIPFRLPQINNFTVSLKCFSDSDNCPAVVIRLLL